jgi:hypothetical protein
MKKSDKYKLKDNIFFVLILVFPAIYFLTFIFIEMIILLTNLYVGFNLPLISDIVPVEVFFYIFFGILAVVYLLMIRDFVKVDTVEGISENEMLQDSHNDLIR